MNLDLRNFSSALQPEGHTGCTFINMTWLSFTALPCRIVVEIHDAFLPYRSRLEAFVFPSQVNCLTVHFLSVPRLFCFVFLQQSCECLENCSFKSSLCLSQHSIKEFSLVSLPYSCMKQSLPFLDPAWIQSFPYPLLLKVGVWQPSFALLIAWLF